MKAFLVFFAMVAFFALSSNQNAEALQCPPGYSSTTIIVDVAGCLYEAEVCYNCDYMTHGEINISVIGFSQHFGLPGEPCDNGLNSAQINSAIQSHVENADFVRDFCYEFYGGIPYCPDHSAAITFKSYICWDIEYIGNPNEGELKYQPCDTSTYCKTTYRYCRDPLSEQIVEYVDYINVFGGPPMCTKEGWEIQVPIENGQKSDCYIYRANCFPPYIGK